MKVLIKIGGSIIAPKHSHEFNHEVIKSISGLLNTGDIFHIVHGTGNVGHSFVKNNTMHKENIKVLQSKLHEYEKKIDSYFRCCTRLSHDDIEHDKDSLSIIVGGTIKDNGEIVSSDAIIKKLASLYRYDYIILCTDVDGVYDDHKNIIKHIDSTNIDRIHFRGSDNDVTGGMKNKVNEIISISDTIHSPIRIINGFYPERIGHILSHGTTIGSRIG